ncbi:5-formyltetrahydrofolate cyclo-ligase [Schaalia odontolytica]|uniref:5-formyltetrahydrofolate cyclo-ligase n=1 Tax=Schaalia odontolytica TaxID=1660 RepID=UPI00210A5BA3|nr:5-formyltetrahydrofolate cyclo-ligase [Schaalia odontolytica]MCQ5272862.1 5-formyltetrahydrofolate cyclo-ligase [Schaalia odontolytica]MCQ5281897.1 5-formyltetrahydrofolate cyclo-ligase [Schaalia odontolytica]
MATKTTLRTEVRSRRRARRADSLATGQLFSPDTSHSPIPVRDRAEAEGIAHQIGALASSMGGVSLPALFVPTPLEPDMSLALGLFERALLPILLDEAGAPLGAPRWGLWEAGQALVTLGRPPAQPDGEARGAESLKNADLIVIPALAASVDGTRLGQGGGWYDRALTHRSPGVPVVAVIFDDEVLEAGVIPTEAHDVPIDAIITPTRTITANAR